MKNAKNVIVGVLMMMTVASYANANSMNGTSANILASTEDKVKVSGVNRILPATLPVLESPAPVVVKNERDTNKYSAEQKAAIVELRLKSQSARS